MESYQILKELIVSNDKGAWERLYELYGKKFFSYCIHRWQLDEDEAWEVVHKTLETLVLKLNNNSFESQAKFDGFLYQVLLNFLRMQYRNKQAREVSEVVYVDFESEYGLSNGVNNVLNESALNMFFSPEGIESADLIRLRDILNQIEPDERDILLLRAQNYSYEEIARLLGVENNQLKVKHHRAKKKLVDLFMQTTNK